MELVANGQVVICANKKHKCIKPEGIGAMLRTKINVNIGASQDCSDFDAETKKISDDRKPEINESCSMCGKFCAVRSMNKALNGEYVDII